MAWKGGGAWGPTKGGGVSSRSDGSSSSDLLWNAVSEAVTPIAHMEGVLEQNKLEKRIRDYFSKAAKGLEFYKPFADVVNEYADKVFSSMFAGLGDREWL